MTAGIAHLHSQYSVAGRKVQLGAEDGERAVLQDRAGTQERRVACFVVCARILIRVDVEAAGEVVERIGDGLRIRVEARRIDSRNAA